jgi:hypothetical protein
MKPLEMVKVGDKINSATRENEVRAAINELMLMTTGPGLLSRDTNLGKVIYAPTSSKKKGNIASFDGGTLTELLQTQATADVDEWDRDTDDCPVSVQLMTDLQYDNVTHKIQARYRTLEFDRGGNLISISAEGDLVDVTTAIACTAQLS